MSTTAFRAMLGDALRHAMTADARDTRGLHVDVDARGRTSQLTFVSRGITAPLGGSEAWHVDLSADSTGVVLNATALDATRVPLKVVARGPKAFALRFLATDDTTWRAGWNDPTRLPAAVEVRFLDRDGRDTMAALVARTAAVGGL